MKRRTFVMAALAAPLATAFAQGKPQITLGYTAATDFVPVFVAVEEGFFKKRGLDVELKFIPLNSTIPAAVQADSLQIGGPTPPVFLQAVDGGLDHVVLAGGSATSKSLTAFALLARSGSGIRKAQDCVGRKIGVPGIGAFLHVTLRAWLKLSGVDHRKVTFIEAAFPQHGDLLRGGSVDAVVSTEPFMSRVIDSGVAYVASYYSTFLPEGLPSTLYTARRDWAEKNPAQVRAFREGLAEAVKWMAAPANDTRMRTHMSKYVKLPPDVSARIQVLPPSPIVVPRQLDQWVGLLKEQEMLRTSLKTATLVAK